MQVSAYDVQKVAEALQEIAKAITILAAVVRDKPTAPPSGSAGGR